MEDARTLAELAKEALQVQDACNLSGVVHGFSRAIARLRVIAREAGWENTDQLNTHPISALWADKIAHLTGTQYLGNNKVLAAYKWANNTVGKD